MGWTNLIRIKYDVKFKLWKKKLVGNKGVKNWEAENNKKIKNIN